MSHFYGTVEGASANPATRCGHKNTGVITHCASYKGAVTCSAYFNEEKQEDWVEVRMVQWQGQGVTPSKLLYRGPIGEFKPSEG